MDRRESLKGILLSLGGYALPGHKLAAGQLAPVQTAPLPQFADVSRQAGLTVETVLRGSPDKDFLLSTTGFGVALIDYDNDSWLDIFVVNSWGLEPFKGGRQPSNHLYHNNRDGTFTDVTEKAGLIHHGWGQGVCAGDYDNDGNLDIFLTCYGQNILYHNNGDGTFTDVTREVGLLQPGGRWNTGAAFLDFDRDGHLDLFVCHYVDYESGLQLYNSNPNLTGTQSPVLYGVAGLKGTLNTLYRNQGNGKFEDVSARAGILKPAPAYSFTPLVGDFDNDGWPDIYVADDSTPSLLFKNNRDGTFTELGLLAGVAYDANGRPQAGMGVDTADYDGDGWLDIFKTNFADETPSLYHNEGRGFFADVTMEAGLGSESSTVKWGTAFADFDNDGLPDLLLVSGPIYPPGVNLRHSMIAGEGRRALYRNLGNGRFEDVSAGAGAGLRQPTCARGLAVGDIFHTGGLSAVINNVNDHPSLLRNQAPPGNRWLLVRLIGTRTNRSAIGSRVMVEVNGRRQIQEVRSGGSFCSQNDLRLHFGLGKAQAALRLEVEWLGGATEAFSQIPSNRLVTIHEGKGITSLDSFRL